MNDEIKELLIDLQQYIDEPNNQDINGEYEPPRELEQGEARLLLDYITNLQEENERLCNALNEVIERNSKAIDKLNTQLAFTSSYQLNYQSAMNIIEETKSILQGVDKE